MQKATEILAKEQEKLLGLMDTLDEVALVLKVGTTVRRRWLLEFNEAIQLTLSSCHYRKDQLLYDALEKNGVLRQGGILGIFEREIQVCHSLLDQMIVAAKAYADGDDAAGVTWAEKTDFFANIYRTHVRRESEVLFPLVEEVLGKHDQKQLSIAFGEPDLEAQKLKKTLHKLRDGFGRLVDLERVEGLF
ncbi:MAG: hemerythrin domain-containing protein [Planctomycetota bacterium]|nr:hemerythrin domain-containing protein [Planctomycetota bacterium]